MASSSEPQCCWNLNFCSHAEHAHVYALEALCSRGTFYVRGTISNQTSEYCVSDAERCDGEENKIISVKGVTVLNEVIGEIIIEMSRNKTVGKKASHL